jgi:hypothetical protein
MHHLIFDKKGKNWCIILHWSLDICVSNLFLFLDIVVHRCRYLQFFFLLLINGSFIVFWRNYIVDKSFTCSQAHSSCIGIRVVQKLASTLHFSDLRHIPHALVLEWFRKLASTLHLSDLRHILHAWIGTRVVQKLASKTHCLNPPIWNNSSHPRHFILLSFLSFKASSLCLLHIYS